ncbi:MAG: hypothetical protein RB191_18695 [Terriglobia bacterium]|nr:hypothetical protein [Terriglobia bacterium]
MQALQTIRPQDMLTDPTLPTAVAPASPQPAPPRPQPQQAAPIPTIRPAANSIPTIRGWQPSPQRQAQEAGLQSSLMRQEAPRTPAKGFWDKAGRVLGDIGNVAGTVILGTNKMAAIPGTSEYRAAREAATGRELTQLETQDQAEQNDEAKRELEGAQTQNLENPSPSEEKPYTLATDHGILQWDGQHWQPVQAGGETVNPPVREGAALHLQRVQGTTGDGKTAFANYDPTKGVFTDQQGTVIPDFKPSDKSMKGAYGGFGPAFLAYRMLNAAYNENPELLPYIAPLISKMLAQGGGEVPGMTQALGTVPIGQPQNDQGTPIGLRMPGAPTGTTRSRGQFAGEVLPTMKAAYDEIDKLADKLGPFSGRYSELVTGKIGAYGPEYSALQTDLHNIATGWGRLHGNSVETMKEFLNDLDTAKNPANLKAKLQRYEYQAEIYKAGGEGKGNNPEPQTGWSAPKDAPPAPRQDGKYLYDGTTPIAKSQGGKWVQP